MSDFACPIFDGCDAISPTSSSSSSAQISPPGTPVADKAVILYCLQSCELKGSIAQVSVPDFVLLLWLTVLQPFGWVDGIILGNGTHVKGLSLIFFDCLLKIESR